MIQVEFKIKQNQLTKEYLHLIEEESVTVIKITCFLMPTRFLIDGVDFFYDKKRPDHSGWRDMPIVGWATEILGLIKKLSERKKDRYVFAHEGYRDILFVMQKDNKIKLTYMETKKVFIVDYDELLNAFLKFEKEVKKFLNEQVPQLKKHPILGPWLANKITYIRDEGFVPIKKN